MEVPLPTFDVTLQVLSPVVTVGHAPPVSTIDTLRRTPFTLTMSFSVSIVMTLPDVTAVEKTYDLACVWFETVIVAVVVDVAVMEITWLLAVLPALVNV
jgi:hypothetical protein